MYKKFVVYIFALLSFLFVGGCDDPGEACQQCCNKSVVRFARQMKDLTGKDMPFDKVEARIKSCVESCKEGAAANGTSGKEIRDGCK